MAGFGDLDFGTTGRVVLRILRPTDVDALVAITDDPAILQAIHFLPNPFSPIDARALIDGQDDDNRFVGVWGAGERLIGVVGIHRRDGDEAEIGYWIGTEFQGANYAREAASGVMAALRKAKPHIVIVAECRPENRASWHTLEKLGFEPTGQDGLRPGRRRLVLK